MATEVAELLREGTSRLEGKSLFGRTGDSLSIRIPERRQFLLTFADTGAFETVEIEQPPRGGAELHAAIYRGRPDAGGILIGRTPWSSALSKLGSALPTMFDEQARHIGRTPPPVPAGRDDLALDALQKGGNALIFGDTRICIGTTPDRVVLNADLFEKCTKAFILASGAGDRVRGLPFWMRHLWGRRLRKAQKRAAESYRAGCIPGGMDAY